MHGWVQERDQHAGQPLRDGRFRGLWVQENLHLTESIVDYSYSNYFLLDTINK